MMVNSSLPRVLLLVDRPDWAFSIIARAIVKHLGDRFDCTILARDDKPVIDESQFDIIHAFFESDVYHRPFLKGRAKIVKSIYSHYWQLEGYTPLSFYEKYLHEAHAITVPSLRLYQAFQHIPAPVFLCPEGVDCDTFRPTKKRTGPLKVGWAGDPHRPIKRLDWIKKACEGVCELHLAQGGLSAEGMAEFYNNIDVIACTSIAEGCPRPLIEGMACGAFPVTFDVGVANEVIEHGNNGLIVRDVSIEGMRKALQWCAENTDTVRSFWDFNAARITGTRSWASTLQPLVQVYYSVLR